MDVSWAIEKMSHNNIMDKNGSRRRKKGGKDGQGFKNITKYIGTVVRNAIYQNRYEQRDGRSNKLHICVSQT